MDLKTTGTLRWSRLLAWVAWGMFTISFFLPAYKDTGIPNYTIKVLYQGWECAFFSVSAASDCLTLKGNPESFHLAVQTLANLWMIASLFLLPFLSRSVRGVRWLRGLSVASLLLVWSYVLRLSVEGYGSNLRIGCFLWATSFVLLVLATMRIGGCKVPATAPA
jgi:hypothetical protein